jgi:Bacteriophage HP1, Orf24
MGARLSGIDVNAMVGDLQVQFEEASLSIEDNSQAVKTKGRPNGHVRGAVAASGELTLDTANLQLMLDAAKAAGSWQELEPFDIVFNAETAVDVLNIEAFDCLVKLSDLLNANSNGEEKLTHKLPFEVTGKDFVRINGVPYAPEADKEYLL